MFILNWKDRPFNFKLIYQPILFVGIEKKKVNVSQFVFFIPTLDERYFVIKNRPLLSKIRFKYWMYHIIQPLQFIMLTVYEIFTVYISCFVYQKELLGKNKCLPYIWLWTSSPPSHLRTNLTRPILWIIFIFHKLHYFKFEIHKTRLNGTLFTLKTDLFTYHLMNDHFEILRCVMMCMCNPNQIELSSSRCFLFFYSLNKNCFFFSYPVLIYHQYFFFNWSFKQKNTAPENQNSTHTVNKTQFLMSQGLSIEEIAQSETLDFN